MSKTSKTDPMWVKLRRESPARQEIHFHENNTCNFDEYLGSQRSWWPGHCGYTVSYYGWNAGICPRGPSRWLKAEVRIRHGAARAQLRKDVRDLLKTPISDIEDYDIINPRPRNGALWDSY